jgi:hypothetical protein
VIVLTVLQIAAVLVIDRVLVAEVAQVTPAEIGLVIAACLVAPAIVAGSEVVLEGSTVPAHVPAAVAVPRAWAVLVVVVVAAVVVVVVGVEAEVEGGNDS